VAPGAPVSVLIDYGLPEKVVERLLETGIGTIEKLGSMTPEELEAIQGIGSEAVEQIQESVNGYYSQFEDPAPEEAAAEAEEPAEAAVTELQIEAEQSGTIEVAGSPTHKPSEGTDPEGTGPEEGTPEAGGQ
jgi:N utilization substance protein A